MTDETETTGDHGIAAALADYGHKVDEQGRHEAECIERIADWRRKQLELRNAGLQRILDDQERLDMESVRLLDTLRDRLGQLPHRKAAIGDVAGPGYPPEIAYVRDRNTNGGRS